MPCAGQCVLANIVREGILILMGAGACAPGDGWHAGLAPAGCRGRLCADRIQGRGMGGKDKIRKNRSFSNMPAVKKLIHGLIGRIRNAKRHYELKMRHFIRRLKIKHKDFCIISNNCWGGTIYQYFGIEYNTPTVGLYFGTEDFVKFAANLRHYMEQELVFIPWESTTSYDFLRKIDQKPFPVARLDDIEIYFMHYDSPEEALEKCGMQSKTTAFPRKVNQVILFDENIGE